MQIDCRLSIKILFLFQISDRMKKLIGVFILVFLLNGCDDGDVTVDTINFDEVSAAKCSTKEIIYKVKENEVLLLNLTETEYNDLFLNKIGSTQLTINTADKIRYRFYNGTVTSASICDDLQPAAPTITEEWVATAATVIVTTTAVMSTPDTETGATRISKYNHNISFRNLVFSKPAGTQVYDIFSFGDYAIEFPLLPLTFDTNQVAICPSSNTIYNVVPSGSAAMFVLNLSPELLSTATPDIAISRPITSTTNNLRYNVFNTPITAAQIQNYFCVDRTTPAASQQWIAESGTIEVTATSNAGRFRYTVRLKGVTFTRDGSSFYYGDDVLYGSFFSL